MHRENLLLSGLLRLAPGDLEWHRTALESGPVPKGDVEAFVYFITSGLAVLRTTTGHHGVQLAFLSLAGSSGLTSPEQRQITVLEPCAGWRVSRKDLQRVAASVPAVGLLFMPDSDQLSAQTVRALCGACEGSVEQRVALWLVEAHHYTGARTISVTHSDLAAFLGVRRASVTVALHVLEGMAAIRSVRHRIDLKNIDLLHEEAGLACAPRSLPTDLAA